MEHAVYPISFFCRNARLSLQKAARARKSRMATEELEHLRNFESLVSDTIPAHPLYSAKRGEKEIVELEFYLSDVIKRLVELKGERHLPARPRSSLSHHGQVFGRSKRQKDSFKSQLAADDPLHMHKKHLRGSRTSRIQPHSSPSSSNSSSKNVIQTLHKAAADHRSKPVPSCSKNSTPVARSPLQRGASIQSTNSRKCKHSGSAKSRSSLDKYVDEVGLPSPRIPVRASVDDCLGWDAHHLAMQDDSINTLMEGFVVQTDEYENTEEEFSPSSYLQEVGWQGLLNGTTERTHGVEDISSKKHTPDSHCFSGGLDGVKASSEISRNLRSAGKERGILDDLHCHFQELASAVEHFGRQKRDANGKNARGRGLGSRISEMEDSFAGLALTENLEQTLKRLGNLQNNVESSEGTQSSANEEKIQSRLSVFGLDSPTTGESTYRLPAGEELAASTSTGLRRGLFKKGLHRGGEVKVDNQSSQAWPGSCGSSSCVDYESLVSSSAVNAEKRKNQDSGIHFHKNSPWQVQDQTVSISKLQEQQTDASVLEGRMMHDGELLCQEDAQDDETVHAVDNELTMNETSGGKSIKAKKVKFEDCREERASDQNGTERNDKPLSDKTQPELGGKGLNRYSSAGTGDAVSRLEKFQVKHFLGKEEHTQHVDDENHEGELDGRPAFQIPNTSLISHDIRSSSFSSSAACGAVPSFSRSEKFRSLSQISSPWDSSLFSKLESQSFNLPPDEADSQFYLHQMDTFDNPQQTTFCNPVFDFDSTLSSKTFPESIQRPMFDTCDVADAGLKSVLGDCTDAASQIQDLKGENNLRSNDPFEADHESLDDIHKISFMPNDIRKEFVDYSASQTDSVLLLELKKKMESFQKMLYDLKETVQSCSTQIHEQVDLWQGRLKGVERELDIVKLETSSELLGLKMLIKNKVNLRTGKSTEGHDARDFMSRLTSNSMIMDEKTGRKLDECASKIDSLQKQVDSWLSTMPSDIEKGVEEAVAESMKELSSTLRSDIEKLELQRLRDFGNLKKEIALKFNLRESKEQLNQKTENELDFIIEEMLEKQLSRLVEKVSAGKEKVTAEMRNELAFLRSEVEALHEGRAEVQGHIEVMTRFAEEIKFKLDKDDTYSDEDHSMLRKQLQVVRKEGMQVRFLVEGMKRETDAEVQDIKLAIEKLKVEGAELREKMTAIKDMEYLLTEEQAELKKLVQNIEKEQNQGQSDIVMLKNFKDELERDRNSLKSEVFSEGTSIMEKVEVLSQLYLGGLEEARTELMNFKNDCGDRLKELESLCDKSMKSTNASLLSSLENRIIELEKEHNCTEVLESKAADILAIAGQHRKLASAAATDAAASAHKAEESLAELLGFISSEMNSTKQKHGKLQESLISDREASSTILLEMMTISADIRKEKDVCLATTSAAKKKGQELVQDIENDLAKMKLNLAEVEKGKDFVNKLAIEISETATNAKEVLHEMMELRRKSVDLSDEVLAELTYTKRRSTELAEEVVAEMANIKRKTVELSQEVVAEIANTKRKSLELGQEVLGEITNTRRKSTQLQEAAANEVASLQSKAEELLTEITRTKRKSMQIQEAAAAEAAAWAARAEEIITDINDASHKTLQCKDKAVTEAAALAGRAEEVITDMMNMRRKCMQLHESMNEAIGNAVRLVQEQSEKETARLRKVMEGEMRKVKSFSEDIEQMKMNSWTPASMGALVSKEEFLQFVTNTELILKELRESMKGLTFDKPITVETSTSILGDDQAQVKYDVKHLYGRVETIASMLEAIFHLNVKSGEQKLQDLLPECLRLGDRLSVLELEKKIMSMEAAQTELIGKIGEIRGKTEDLEKSIAVWVPKYDTAARVLNEVESRLGALEANSEKRLPEQNEKDTFLSFYKDLTGKNQSLDGERTTRNIDAREKGMVKSLDSRVIILESRIEHVASATYTNLRILDTKVEHISGSLETALESATMAEKKCNLLGAELVKVFRILANSGKASPEKPSSSSKTNESRSRYSSSRFIKPDMLLGRRKDQTSATRMHQNKALRGENKLPSVRGTNKLPEINGQVGASKDSALEERGKFISKSDANDDMGKKCQHVKTHSAKNIHVGARKAISVVRCNFETFESDDACSESNLSMVQNGRKNSVEKSNSVQQDSSKIDDADHTVNSSRLNSLKNPQKNEFHIDSGKIHVNVSHKSRIFS